MAKYLKLNSMILLNIWNGGLLLLPLIGLGAAGYCGYRYSKNKSLIALGVGILLAGLSIWGLSALIADK